MSTPTLQSRAGRLIKEQGSLRAAARFLNIDPSYLFRMARGDKMMPSDPVLKRMGLRRIITYANV